MARFRWLWKKLHIKEVQNSHNMCVVMGFPRSGTSLVSSLVADCGYSFGEESSLKKRSDINPGGFYENLHFFTLLDKCLKQAGYTRSYAPDESSGVSAKGVVNRVKRYFTRRQLRNVIAGSIQKFGKFAVKSTPLNFYFFRNYIPQCKIVAVYRDPVVTAHSNTKIFSKGDTFGAMLRYWARSNEEMLYLLSTRESLLIRYEDLFDEKFQNEILQHLTEFLGGGDTAKMKSCIKPGLVRSRDEISSLQKQYPTSEEVKKVFQALEVSKYIPEL